jgi:hypothetical protein
MERRPLDAVPPPRDLPRIPRRLQTLREMEAERDALKLELARARSIIANCGSASSAPPPRGAR